VNLRANLGSWLNVAWDDATAATLIALDETTVAAGAPVLRVSAIRKLGLAGKAALVAAPRPAILDVIRRIEKQHGLPCPTLGGQWAKTSAEVRQSWMITGLTMGAEPAAVQPERVFRTAQALGIKYVVIALNWWNTSLGGYSLQT
jgi:hypothetical protein